MVLPTPELVEELHRVLAKHNCSGITSIGSGGRLDFERQLARHPSNPRIKAIDMLEPTIVVDEDVVYTQTLNCWEAPAVGKEDVMLFCWGTTIPPSLPLSLTLSLPLSLPPPHLPPLCDAL